MTSEQGNPPEKGEAPDERAPETDASAEAGSNPGSAPEPVKPDDAEGGAPEAPTVDEGATEAVPASALADTDIPAAPAADAAPEPEAPQAAPEAPAAPEVPQAPSAPSVDEGVTEAVPASALADADVPAAPAAAPEPEAPAAPEAPNVDEGATQAIPTGAAADIDVPEAPAADNTPEQVAPAAPEPPAGMPSAGPQFDEDGTQILRLGPSSSPPAPSAPYAGPDFGGPPAADPNDERTEVLPPQGVSGFNAPAPYGDQSGTQGQSHAASSAWPSPPPNPLSSPGAVQSPGQFQSQGAMPPPPPAPQGPPAGDPYAQPPSAYQQQPPPGSQPQQPPTQSDDTQKLIIGAHNPYSEPPSMAPGYDPAQAAQSQPQTGQYSQPGMPPGSVPPGQYPPQPVPGSSGGRKKGLVPILVTVAALVVVAAGVGVYFLLFAAPKFEEGGCVRHTSGDQAEAIDCADAKEGEDYEIVQEVGDGQECADAGRETLTVGEDVYCLTLLGAPDDGAGGEEPAE